MMKMIWSIVFLALFITCNDAKNFDSQDHLIELNRQEAKAYKDLHQAEQEALLGKISKEQLQKIEQIYNSVKNELEKELSKLPNRPEVEQWLIDNGQFN